MLRHLQTQPDVSLRLLVRSPDQAQQLSAPGVETVVGDLAHFDRLCRWAEGADQVYHIAGLNQMCLVDPDPLYRTNVDGTRNVWRAAGETGVRRLVYTSSAATIGEEKGEVGTEDTVHRGWHRSYYERSKFLAEQMLRTEAAAYPELELVTVNPSSVQGPGRATGTGRLLVGVLSGRWRWLVDTYLSVVDIGDCARGHLAAALHGKPGERYLLNSFTLHAEEVGGVLEKVAQQKFSLRMVPHSLVRVGARLSQVWGRYRGKTPLLCRETAETLLAGHRFDGSKATRELGLEYSTPEETLTRFWDWAKTERLL